MPTIRQPSSAEELAREHTAKAIETLAEEMDSAFESRDRIRAAEALLDRGHGKPSQAIIAVPGTKRQQLAAAGMTDDQLVAIIEQKQLPKLAPSQPLITVDAKPKVSSHGPLDNEDAIDPMLL